MPYGPAPRSVKPARPPAPPPLRHRGRVHRGLPAGRAGRAADVEGVHAGRLEFREVGEDQAAADQEPRLVAGLAVRRTGPLGQQGGQAVGDARRRARRQVRVQAGQPGQFLAQRGAVGGPVDGPVERPPAALDGPGQRADGRQVGPPVRVEEAEDELLRALGPQRGDRRAQRVHLTGRESVGGAQHHPHRDADGRPDRREGARRGGETVGGHVADEFEAVGAAGLGGHRVRGVERDHLQECALGHGSPFLRRDDFT